MGKIFLYNQNFFWPANFKSRLKAVLGLKERGPAAVLASLQAGLAELSHQIFLNNKNNLPQDAAACVLSGTAVLKWAIAQKKAGKIGKIFAGPNVVVLPSDCGGLLKDSAIDQIIVPSQWVKDLYVKQAPELANKIFVWAAGVDLPIQGQANKEYDFLILSKTRGNSTLADEIQRHLSAKKVKTSRLIYGKFNRQQYFNLLNASKYLIYLSDSESQGLAMFEAWAHNVPTLVWDKGVFTYQGLEIAGNVASSYLTAQTGARFKDYQDFTKVLPEFMSANYSPRSFIENNFTNKLSAQKYLDIIYER